MNTYDELSFTNGKGEYDDVMLIFSEDRRVYLHRSAVLGFEVDWTIAAGEIRILVKDVGYRHVRFNSGDDGVYCAEVISEFENWLRGAR